MDGDGERTEVLKDCAVAEESDDGDSEETSPIGVRRPKRECPIKKVPARVSKARASEPKRVVDDIRLYLQVKNKNNFSWV